MNNSKLFPLSFFFIFGMSNLFGSINVLLDKNTFYLGDTIKIIIKDIDKNTKVFCSFNKKKYPAFVCKRNKKRILVGVSSDVKPGEYLLIVKVKKIFFSKEWKSIINIKGNKFPTEKINFSNEKKVLIEKASRIKDDSIVIDSLKTITEKQYWEGKFILPAKGKITTSYGTRRKNKENASVGIHRGIDISSSYGDSVVAPNNGLILLTGEFILYGKMIIIDHGNGVCTLYLHLDSIDVKEGEYVKKGIKIGRMGSTGLSTGPHLHWGLYVFGDSVAPLVWTQTEF